MARGRMINITIAGDMALNDLSLEAHLAYLMAIPHLDRDGLLPGHPKLVKGRICPLRDELGAKIADIIQEWIAAGLVISYLSDNGAVLYFTGFQKNQGLGALYAREAKSIFPPPPGYIRTESGLIQEKSDNPQPFSEPTHDELMTNSNSSHAEVEVEVEDQENEKRRDATAKPSKPPTDPAVVVFHDVWKRNPNKPQMRAISERVTDLDLWREACQAWGDRGHKATNVDGMLDWYDHPDRFRTEYRPPPRGGDYRSTNNGVNAIMDYVRERGMVDERN